jgi:hypothetical protein
MKRIAAIFLALIIIRPAIAQQEMRTATKSFRFSKKVSFVNQSGKNFRYEMAVRADEWQNGAGVKFYGISADMNGKPVPGKFEKLEQRKEQEWVIYTIVGQLPASAVSESFYADIPARGTWYFDDINLYVEQSAGSWKQLDVDNASFEEQSDKEFTGFALSQNRSGNIKAALSSEVFKTGQRSLMISFTVQKETIHLAAGE